jgi:DNA-binding protein Fis
MPFVSPPPLGMPVPIIGITGEVYVGKTILALSLAPGVHAKGHPHEGQPRTLYIDFEQSGASYTGTGCKRLDAPAELRTLFGNRTMQPVDVFKWFRDLVGKIPADTYDCIVVDPITDVEDGLVDYVRANPTEFGYTKDQFANASGLMWGAVKNLWKAILVDLSSKAHIFCFVSHMRMEFKDGRPTRKLVPKGKETLSEIAALYLQLSRDKSRDGEKPNPPSAILLKERLAVTEINAQGEVTVKRILPDRLPEATAKALRYYIAHPVGSRKAKPEELVQELVLSDDEKRILELEIEQAKADAAKAALALAEMGRVNMIAAASNRPVVTPPAAAPEPTRGGATDAQLDEIRLDGREYYGEPPAFGAAFVAFWAEKGKAYKALVEMSDLDADIYKHHLKSLVAKKRVADKTTAVKEKLKDLPPDPIQGQPLPPTDNAAPIEPFHSKEPMTEEQMAILRPLCNPEVPGAMSAAEQEAFQAHFGVKRLRDLNQGQYQELMTRRAERLAKSS